MEEEAGKVYQIENNGISGLCADCGLLGKVTSAWGQHPEEDGGSNHTSEDRQREDYYSTHPDMVRDLLNAGAPLQVVMNYNSN